MSTAEQQAEGFAAMLAMLQECPTVEGFIASIDVSPLRRLLGVFLCEPEDYEQTEKVLARHGHLGYETVRAKIEGDRGDAGRQPWGWAAVVRKADSEGEESKTAAFVVRRFDDNALGRWFVIGAAAHEVGHALDLEQTMSQPGDQRFDIRAAEYAAHCFACRLLRERRMAAGLLTYLSAVIWPIAKKTTSAGRAARDFMSSDEYRRCIEAIPDSVRNALKVPLAAASATE